MSNVIRNLGEKYSYINFRDSKLTRILQPCLTGNSKTVVICTVNQVEDCLGESINTLKFGTAANAVKMSICKNVVNSLVKNKHRSDEAKYEELY